MFESAKLFNDFLFILLLGLFSFPMQKKYRKIALNFRSYFTKNLDLTKYSSQQQASSLKTLELQKFNKEKIKEEKIRARY